KMALPGSFLNKHVIKDNYKRQKFAEAEVERLALRYIVRSTELPSKTRLMAQIKLATMPKYTSITQVHNRCITSGYGRNVDTKTRLCHKQFRTKALEGYLTGIKKASW
ncbi:hypothetical protein CANCADRAFT_19213, partial [Tortispora caseinolytica NRRL Y-17796]